MRVLTAAGFVLLASVGSSLAETDWSGPYVGVTGGAAKGDVSVTNPNGGVPMGPFEYDVQSLTAGAVAGVNLDLGGFVLGVEGQVSMLWPDGSGYIASSDERYHQDLTISSGVLADLTGRAGFGFDDLLFYGKAGVAMFTGESSQKTTRPGYETTTGGGFVGGTIGVGVEYRMQPQVSLRLEYQHYAFDNVGGYQTNLGDNSSPIGYEFDYDTALSFDTIKAGVSFGF